MFESQVKSQRSRVKGEAKVLLTFALFLLTFASPFAQSDLDDLMRAVLARRDDNWKKLQQYTLNEKETLQITALAVFRLYGFDREYFWFPRAGFFIRSPLKADGVTIGEDKRRQEEERWLRRSQSRERRVAERRKKGDEVPDDDPAPVPGDVALSGNVEDIINQSFEPQFIQSANFMRFKFDEGQYALVGREKMLDRDVLKIEYYPKLLFRDAPGSKNVPATKDDDDKFEDMMNKTSLVTLWVDPAERQILRYEFRNVDMDFLPARWLVRINSMRATMQMAEPFPNVWLPESVSMRFRMTRAAGPFEGNYNVKYSKYKLAETSGRIVP